VLLEEAKLNESANGDEDEANGAKSSRLLVSDTLLNLALDLHLFSEAFFKLLVEGLNLGNCIFDKLIGLIYKLLLLLLVKERHISNLNILIHLHRHLLRLLLHFKVVIESFEELLEIEVLEISATKIHWVDNGTRCSRNTFLLSDLRIHLLESDSLAMQEVVANEESNEAVNSSSEGNVGILLPREPFGNNGSHDELEKYHRDQGTKHAHLEEVVIKTELKLGGLLGGSEVRNLMGPGHVAGLSDIAGIPFSGEKGRDGIDEKDYPEQGEADGATRELLVEHLNSEVSKLGSLIQGQFFLGLGSSATTEPASRSEHTTSGAGRALLGGG